MLNGFFVIRLKMNAFIVTLASFIWVRGLVVAISGGRSAQDLAPSLRFIGIYQILYVPLIAWIAIGCFVLFSFIMSRTPFGRHVTLIGGNAVAAFRAGIKVDRLMFISFILAGAIAGVAGWLLAIRTSGATANLGVGMLFHAFAAVVIGGVSLKGGVGRLPGVYAGVLLLSSIHTAINLMGLPGSLHAGDPGRAGARRRAARHIETPDPPEVRMTARLEGKVALVIGAARGIGEGIAERFVEEGAKVVIADTEVDAGKETASAAEWPLHRDRHLALRPCAARGADGTRRLRRASTFSCRTPASIPGR